MSLTFLSDGRMTELVYLAGNGNVTFYEFLPVWQTYKLGTTETALRMFLNLDIDRNAEITLKLEIPYVWSGFDFDGECLLVPKMQLKRLAIQMIL